MNERLALTIEGDDYDREATPYQNTRLGKRNPRQHYNTLWKEARSSLQCETRGQLDKTRLGKRNPLTTPELGEAILHKHTTKGKRNPLTTPELGEAILHDNTRNPERIERRIEWMSKQSLCQILIDLCTDRPSWQSLRKEEWQIQNWLIFAYAKPEVNIEPEQK